MIYNTARRLLLLSALMLTGYVLPMFSAVASEHLPEKLVFSAIENSENSLISAKVMKEAYQRLGISVEVRFFPAKRALLLSNNGAVDGELFRIDGMNAQFPNLIQVPVAINLLEGVAYSKHLKFPVNGWPSISPYRIAVRRGVKFTEIGTAGMNVKVVNSNTELFDQLEADLVDVVALARLNGITVYRNYPETRIQQLEGNLVTHPLYHYLHKRHKELVPVLEAVLKELESEGKISAIREAHIRDLSEPQRPSVK